MIWLLLIWVSTCSFLDSLVIFIHLSDILISTLLFLRIINIAVGYAIVSTPCDSVTISLLLFSSFLFHLLEPLLMQNLFGPRVQLNVMVNYSLSIGDIDRRLHVSVVIPWITLRETHLLIKFLVSLILLLDRKPALVNVNLIICSIDFNRIVAAFQVRTIHDSTLD